MKVSDINTFSSSYFGVYRRRLIDEGLIYSLSYGVIEFTLPRLNEFLKLMS